MEFTPLQWINIALAGILVLLVVLLIVKKLSLKRRMKVHSGVKKKRKSFFGKLDKNTDDVDVFVQQFHKLVESERELKMEEGLLTRKIEDLYHMTQHLSKDAPQFNAVNENIDIQKSSKDAIQEPEKSVKPISPNTSSSQALDEETKKVLRMADDLLEKLPEEVINSFVSSEDFKVYQKIVNKAKQ